MKKILLLTFALFMAVFAGCDKDDEDDNKYVLEISSVNGDDGKVTEIRGISSALNKELSSVSAKNKPMQLKLPEKVASKYLVDIGFSFPAEYATVSDPDVLWSEVVYISGYDDSGKLIGEYVQANLLSDRIIQYIFYCYVEKAVTITGTPFYEREGREVEMEINLSFTAGWNRYSQKVYFDRDVSEDDAIEEKVVIDNKITGILGWFFFPDQDTN